MTTYLSSELAALAERAWAAGLFDGEGAVFTANGGIKLQLKMIDQPTVERFCRAVGTGKVYGPYKNRSGEKDGYPRSDFYMWVSLKGQGFKVLHQLWPYMSDFRRARAIECGYTH